MRVGIQGVKPVRKCLSSWLRATARGEGIYEPSTGTLDLTHRPGFALCEKADQVLKILNQVFKPLTNYTSLKTGAVEATSKYLGGDSSDVVVTLLPLYVIFSMIYAGLCTLVYSNAH
jgi:hypothetical protein